MAIKFLCSAILFSFLVIRFACCSVTIHTKIGTIVGLEDRTTVKGVTYTLKKFLGIPYALPPVGDRRFERPIPMLPFNSPFEANRFGPACPQSTVPSMPVYNTTSEDCLYLNIYVPDQKPDLDVGHAVMVFIHGGGFMFGAGETYPAENLCSFGNVVVVTINYRLGVFGFMSSGDDKIRGNAGLFDQHLALRWVNKYIGAFGGDKDRVTIFGESAGGSSVIFQGLFPQNKGIIHRMISESGVPTADTLIMPDPKKNFQALARELGCDLDNSIDEAIVCLKDVETNKIMDVLLEMFKDTQKAWTISFVPSVDGEFIKIIPSAIKNHVNTDAREQIEFFRSLDLISGFTDKDGAVFLLTSIYPVENMDTFSLSREDFVTKAAPTVIKLAVGNIPDAVKSVIISEYTNWTDPNLPENNRDQYVKIIGDTHFTVSSIEMSRLHTNITDKSQNSYAYFFTAEPGTHALKSPKWLRGANHGDEIGFVFLFPEEFVAFVELEEGSRPIVHDWEYELSYQIGTYWTNFAKTGNPNQPREVGLHWPRYDIGEQQYINFDKDILTGKHLCAREANLWLKIVPELKESMLHDHNPESPFVQKKDGDSCSSDGTCEDD